MSVVVQKCDFRPGDYVDNQYCVEKILGEGSFGKVFKVKDSGQDSYALKLLRLWEIVPGIRRQLIDRFDMEYETGQIKSRYLVQSVTHGFAEGNPYIVMEFCPNGDLMYHISHSHPDLSRVARHILYGLRDLHRCGKVHRDLKPENVLFKDDDTAALTDFGISGDRNKRMTERNILGKPSQIFGTYAYMPPEQVNPKRGDATVLPTTDIFSFGVMMYQVITGVLPFGRLENVNDLALYMKRGREGDWNRKKLSSSGKDVHFQNIIEGCLIPDFKSRLQTVDAVLSLFPQAASNDCEPSANMDDFSAGRVINGVMLRVMQGDDYGTVYKLNDLLNNGKRMVTIGRGDPDTFNTIPIREEQSSYISRKHCTLEWSDDTRCWLIRDGQWDRLVDDGWKSSLNGTYVNSAEVPIEGIFFQPGDIISIGDVKLRAEGY